MADRRAPGTAGCPQLPQGLLMRPGVTAFPLKSFLPRLAQLPQMRQDEGSPAVEAQCVVALASSSGSPGPGGQRNLYVLGSPPARLPAISPSGGACTLGPCLSRASHSEAGSPEDSQAWGWPAGTCPRGPCGPDALAALPSPQSSKVLAKRELLYVPLIGWTWYFLEIVFCKRKWEEDRDAVIKGLRRLASYPEYVWVSEG